MKGRKINRGKKKWERGRLEQEKENMGMREEDNRPRSPRSVSHRLSLETKDSQDRWKTLGRS